MRTIQKILPATLAFAAGVAVGVLCERGVRSGEGVASTVESHRRSAAESRPRHEIIGNVTMSSHMRKNVDTREDVDVESSPRQESSVEVTYADASADTPPEITAAHRARQAKRAAAREVKAAKRRDFLAALNLELLTPAQRELHAEYTEAIAARDVARKEILALRANEAAETDDDRQDSGRTRRFDELQRRIADAESVIRADASDERRALREAAARAHGLDDTAVHELLEDFDSVDSVLGL